MKRKVIVTCVAAVLLAVCVFSVYKLVTICTDYKKADSTYENLQNKYVQTVSDEATSAETSNGETSGVESQTSENVTNGLEPINISVDFNSLLQENKDVVGWLYCEDTPINYPVVQGEDNNQYLYADLNGGYIISGTIFVDYRNGDLGADRNYIVYGHNMKNNTMFGSLVKYKQQSYYDAHPTIDYLTPNGNYTIELLVGLVVDTADLIYWANPSEDELTDYMTKAREKSTFDSGLAFSEDDTLVTLSTCSYEFDNARYVVVGRLVPNN